MPDISDSNYSLFPAEKAAQDLSISLATLFELASQEKCSFLIDIPDAVEVYIRGRDTLRSGDGIFGRPANRRLQQEPLIRVHREIEFLCLKPSECSLLMHRVKIGKKVFPAVGLMNADGSVECIDTLSYTKRYPDQRHQKLNMFGGFLTYQPSEEGLDWLGQQQQPTTEKSVPIRTDSLLICANDLDKIARRSRATGRNYGKFEPEPWTSTMLAHLNEASTFFFSAGGNVDKAIIKDWFRQRWAHREVGRDVIEQATNAILPDHLYRDAPPRNQLSQDTINNYNDYASSALIIMNEAAKGYWKAMESRRTKKYFALRYTIIKELSGPDGKGFTRKLAGATATIIRPD
ncbi:hypothetical protein [Marinobacter zhanjiangensis]|uniref:Phage/plasmid replication protein, gene II/X family n=1 Tax=Marinobacter zhanjiangensis TaxID=578215 RepID=A0ABQ3B9A1_9GAMM|nr:hypothetical protein [Marinobacter zhanjiangensis]GGY79919.1 hypothetical protein GCM10007071_29020 [Marinobacter zhanjiangensis]